MTFIGAKLKFLVYFYTLMCGTLQISFFMKLFLLPTLVFNLLKNIKLSVSLDFAKNWRFRRFVKMDKKLTVTNKKQIMWNYCFSGFIGCIWHKFRSSPPTVLSPRCWGLNTTYLSCLLFILINKKVIKNILCPLFSAC